MTYTCFINKIKSCRSFIIWWSISIKVMFTILFSWISDHRHFSGRWWPHNETIYAKNFWEPVIDMLAFFITIIIYAFFIGIFFERKRYKIFFLEFSVNINENFTLFKLRQDLIISEKKPQLDWDHLFSFFCFLIYKLLVNISNSVSLCQAHSFILDDTLLKFLSN